MSLSNFENSSPTVQEVMKPVSVLASSASVSEAARVMKETEVNVIPVGEQDELRGVITSRAVAIAAMADSSNPHGIPVEEIAQPIMTFCGEHEAVGEAVKRMDSTGADHLLVRGVEGNIVGVLAAADVLHAVADEGAESK